MSLPPPAPCSPPAETAQFDELAQILDMAQLSTWDFDLATETFTLSERLYACCGTTAAQEGGRTMTAARFGREFLLAEDLPVIANSIARLRCTAPPPTDWETETRLRRRDGEIRHVLVRIVVRRDRDGQVIGARGLNQDVTDSRRTALALRESEEKFAVAFRSSPIAMAIRDLTTGRYVEVNDRAIAQAGYTREEIIGHTSAEIGWVAPESRAIFASMQSDTSVKDLEIGFIMKNGRRLTLSYSSFAVTIGGRPMLLSISRDVTAQRRNEQERDALTRTIDRKNRELQNLIYVTSHDLRSPLLNIQGFSQRVAAACEQVCRLTTPDRAGPIDADALAKLTTQQIPKSVGHILTSVEKMDRLINGLVRLSQLDRAELTLEPLDLNAMLEKVTGAMAFAIESTGAIVETGPLPACHGDAVLINQLFTNLLDNALKYRDPARPPRLSVTGTTEAGRVVYCVADNGIGISPSNLEKIWELFYRVDPRGPTGGDGLGLNLVRRIVERHQGEIRVESTPGVGSRFVVQLPLSPGPLAVAGHPA